MTADIRTAAQREPDYNRLCAECAYGKGCSQPYESADGTVYECKRIIPPALMAELAEGEK